MARPLPSWSGWVATLSTCSSSSLPAGEEVAGEVPALGVDDALEAQRLADLLDVEVRRPGVREDLRLERRHDGDVLDAGRCGSGSLGGGRPWWRGSGGRRCRGRLEVDRGERCGIGTRLARRAGRGAPPPSVRAAGGQRRRRRQREARRRDHGQARARRATRPPRSAAPRLRPARRRSGRTPARRRTRGARAARPDTRGASVLAACASSEEKPWPGMPRAAARPWAVASATRTPVNDPGPRDATTPSSASRADAGGAQQQIHRGHHQLRARRLARRARRARRRRGGRPQRQLEARAARGDRQNRVHGASLACRARRVKSAARHATIPAA